jgi:hypothetical protein
VKIRWKIVRIFDDTFAERILAENLTFEEAQTWLDEPLNHRHNAVEIRQVDWRNTDA